MVNTQSLNINNKIINRLKKRRNKLINRLGKIKNNDFKTYGLEYEGLFADIKYDEIVVALAETIRKELKQIDNAIWRIENNTYSNCSLCKKNISLDRQELFPYTDKCKTCALLQTIQTINSIQSKEKIL
ncbi:MAG: TraR/DksA family transcriptional regulator [Thermodesulfobacteriota bacterium]